MQAVWWLTKDGDRDLLAAYETHYSAYRYKDGRKRSQCIGPGQTIVLRTLDGTAFFVWRKFIDDSGQQGVNNAIFINRSEYLSSELIRQACAIADIAWPNQRRYTYVDPKKVRSTNPGFCYLKAGWQRCGMTKSGLMILEREANAQAVSPALADREENELHSPESHA